VFDSQQLMAELLAYVLAEDLTHVKRTIDSLQPMERSHKGWAAACRYARGEYHRIRGDHGAALQELDAAFESMQPCCHVLWAPACGAYAKTLGALGRYSEAKAYAEASLALAEQNELGFMDAHIRLALALTLSKLGEHDGAVAAADAVIQRFTAVGTSGLNLAAAYEARAIVASAAGDTAGFGHFAGLCRSQLPRGSRFLQKATHAVGVRRAGSSKLQDTTTSREAGYLSRVDSEIQHCALPLERTRRAIEVMVEFSGAAGGLLYLRGNDGIDCAASAGKSAPSDVSFAVVNRYFARACGSVATFVATETSRLSQIATSASLFETLGAHHYVPVLLSHRDERGLAITGLALFVLEPGISFEWPDRLATQLSSCFAGAGDATAKYL
jgi:tetratricopeptide (TPR) repeat protein